MMFSISGLYNGHRPENMTISGGSFSASVANYAAKTLNFEVDRGDGWFSYFTTAEDALEYAGDASGVKITGVGGSANLRSCTVSVFDLRSASLFYQSSAGKASISRSAGPCQIRTDFFGLGKLRALIQCMREHYYR